MWIVKLGGSLAADASLKDWLEVLARHGGGRVIVAPGGGPFAQCVREAQENWGFPDPEAHRMALLGMDQYALMLSGLCPELVPAESLESLYGVLKRAGVAVWLPAAMALEDADIRQNWEVTSDSLAAWVAGRLSAERLLLVKSCSLPRPDPGAAELARLGIVDAAFPAYVHRACFDVTVLHKDERDTMRALLIGGHPIS